MKKPKLRAFRSEPFVQEGRPGVLISDPLGISKKILFIPHPTTVLLALMDGMRDTGTLRTAFELRTGRTLSDSSIEQLISQLEDALLIDNEQYVKAHSLVLSDYRNAPSRYPTLAGKNYPADPRQLRTFIQQYLDGVDIEGLPVPGDVKGLICPHIDIKRGGDIYARVWSEARAAVREAELVVILGTDHNEGQGRVTLTRQVYQTPWGTIPTAQDVVDEFEHEIGDSIFECELNHRGEHSIESALVWLHHTLAENACPILPVLCGSFHNFVDFNKSPLTATHITSTIEILKRVAQRKRTIFVAAADLAHIGPVFGDPLPVDFVGRSAMTRQDTDLISVIGRGKADDFFAVIEREKDRRHVCGVPPIYISLSVLSGTVGIPAGYAQCPASEDGSSLVSICGMIFT